jgi:hypothetical protein
MNTFLFSIRRLASAFLILAPAPVFTQLTHPPVVNIRSAANPAFKVEAAAVQYTLLSPDAEAAGSAERDIAVYTYKPGMYVVTPVKDSDPLRGVSILDLIKIVRHIQNIEPFAEPWQWVAADIDRDNAITYNDVRQLHQLLMDPFSELTDNQSWRFFDTRHVFPATFPLEEPIPESVASTLSCEQEVFCFKAVKVGDVDGSATNIVVPQQEPSDNVLQLNQPDRLLQAGEEIFLAVSVNDASLLWGLQGALRFNGEFLQLVSAEPGNVFGMGRDGIHISPQRKELRFSWLDAFPQRFTDESILMTIRLKARKEARLQEAVSSAPALLQPAAFDAKGQTQPLRLSLTEISQSAVLNVAKKSLFLNVTETPQPPQTHREFSAQEEW